MGMMKGMWGGGGVPTVEAYVLLREVTSEDDMSYNLNF